MIWLHATDDGWSLSIIESEMPQLFTLPARLRALLESGSFSDRVAARLFPAAYREDEEAEREYQRLLRDDLVRGKLEAAAKAQAAIDARIRHKAPDGRIVISEIRLSREDLALWLGFLHDMRLTIGTGLGIEDEGWETSFDPASPDYKEVLLLNELAYIEELLIAALREAEGLDS